MVSTTPNADCVFTQRQLDRMRELGVTDAQLERLAHIPRLLFGTNGDWVAPPSAKDVRDELDGLIRQLRAVVGTLGRWHTEKPPEPGVAAAGYLGLALPGFDERLGELLLAAERARDGTPARSRSKSDPSRGAVPKSARAVGWFVEALTAPTDAESRAAAKKLLPPKVDGYFAELMEIVSRRVGQRDVDPTRSIRAWTDGQNERRDAAGEDKRASLDQWLGSGSAEIDHTVSAPDMGTQALGSEALRQGWAANVDRPRGPPEGIPGGVCSPPAARRTSARDAADGATCG